MSCHSCDKLKIGWELVNLANRHPRVNICSLVGGWSFIAVDPWFIISSVPDKTQLMRAAREVNDYKPLGWLKKFKLRLLNI